jgi:hypothetical protein
MYIKVRNIDFLTSYLKEVTLEEAIAHYRKLPEDLVKEAYYKVNKKRKKKKD